jgi:N utilization substance protein A
MKYDVYRDNEGEVEEFDIDLDEFSDEIDGMGN